MIVFDLKIECFFCGCQYSLKYEGQKCFFLRMCAKSTLLHPYKITKTKYTLYYTFNYICLQGQWLHDLNQVFFIKCAVCLGSCVIKNITFYFWCKFHLRITRDCSQPINMTYYNETFMQYNYQGRRIVFTTANNPEIIFYWIRYPFLTLKVTKICFLCSVNSSG